MLSTTWKRLRFFTACAISIALYWTLSPTNIAHASSPMRPLMATTHTVGGACGATIQACINSATPGDTVKIPAGTYVESVILDKAVSVIGAGQQNTILSAPPTSRAMLITGTIGSSVVISGFSVTGGYLYESQCPAGCGAGIMVTGTVTARLENLTLTGNENGSGKGGGLYVGPNSRPTLRRLHVHHNIGYYGGAGIYLAAPLAVTESRIENNATGISGSGGGGIYAESSLWLTDTIVYSNTSGSWSTAVFVAGDFFASHSRFEKNGNSEGSGPSVWVLQRSEIEESDFLDNRGSGLYVEGPTIIRGGQFAGHRPSGAVHSLKSLQLIDVDFSNNEAAVSSYGGGAVYALGDLAIQGGRFISNTAYAYGGAIYAIPIGGVYCGGSYGPCLGSLQVSDAEFIGNHASTYYGGAIYAQVATTLTNSLFEQNEADGGYAYGGAVYIGGHVSSAVAGSRFISNTAHYDGGALYVGQETSTTIHASHFEGNHSIAGSGGAIYIGATTDPTDSLVMTDTYLLNNWSNLMGGAIYAPGWLGADGMMFNGVTFEGNQASDGGAIYTGSFITVINSVFLNNTATATGGGLWFTAIARLVDSRFEGNQAGTEGGGIVGVQGGAAPPAELIVRDTVFTKNRAGTRGGGAVSIIGTISDAHFLDNEAGEEGGALYLSNEYASTAPIYNSEFVGNQAKNGGAVVTVGRIVPWLFNNRFEDNQASENGGALVVASAIISQTHFLANSAVGDGGALWVTCCGSSTVDQSYLIANQASNGGAIAYSGSYGQAAHTNLTINNTLMARNRATGTGAAFYHTAGSATFDYVTITDSKLNPKVALDVTGACYDDYACFGPTLNNTILDNHVTGIKLNNSAPDNDGAFVTLNYVLLSNLTTPVEGNASWYNTFNSFRGDPDFVAPAQDDYHLGAASQARDAASTGPCPPVDIENTSRPQGLGCDIGAFEGKPMSPAIAISPTTFHFIAMQSVGQPAAQTLKITNIGVGTLNWNTTSNASWLTTSPTSGSQNSQSEVRVNHSGLAVGTHAGKLTINGNATNPSVTADVTVEVLNACVPLISNGDFEKGNDGTWSVSSSQGTPLIRSQNEMSDFGTPHSGSQAVVLGSQNGNNDELSQSIKLPSGGALTLAYYYQIDSDETNCTFDTVRVLFGDVVVAEHGLCQTNNTNGWTKKTVNLTAYGNQQDDLRFVLQNDAFGSPSTFLLDDVVVSTEASTTCDAPVLQVTPKTLSFTATVGEDNPAAQSIQINNSGIGEINWTATSTVAWLNLDSTSGVAPSTLNVSVDASGLPAGAHEAQITITAPGATDSPQTIAVTLIVAEAGAEANLQVSPVSLAFTATGNNPASQTFTIQYGGNSTWTAAESIAWLTLNPTSGNSNAEVQVLIDAAGITRGTYGGQIVISAPGTVPQVLTINLTITEEVEEEDYTLRLPNLHKSK